MDEDEDGDESVKVREQISFRIAWTLTVVADIEETVGDAFR